MLNLPEKEQEILKFWKDNKIFEKTLEKTKKGSRFVFFEGPPFANGLPGIHHLLSRAMKDIFVRYKTMQGFFVERKAGWDTHGLPTEMSAEKEMGIKDKKEIEADVSKFIEVCKNNVFIFKKEWEDFTERMGYWIDLNNPYITCSNEYIESLWWILKQMWDKKLLFEDYKVVPYCPRCGTSLSSHEVAQGYKEVTEKSVYVKFRLKEDFMGEKDIDFLVWTTTPWTLPANVAIAVGENINYVLLKSNEAPILQGVRNQNQETEREKKFGPGKYIVAKKMYPRLFDVERFKILKEFKGSDLLNKKYNQLFNFSKPEKGKEAFLVVAGNDFVSDNDGTGLVHIAPAFGEDDMNVAKSNNLQIILNVDEEGKFKEEVEPWKGKIVKKKDDDKGDSVNDLIIKNLEERKLLREFKLYKHEYPFCWRCDSPLLYYAKRSWFIKVTEIKEKLIEANKKINWYPEYLKSGRFGEWLRDVKDWNLSRERYWGAPLPIWRCKKCNEDICIGSIKELEKLSDKKIEDLHRPTIDEVEFKCECGGKAKRVLVVIDCWFDSGAMPFAQWHYPFENKERIDKGESFPADFICEGIDQTRGWFYTLLVISVALGFESPYKNVISNGIVLDAKGKKMSKSKGNIVKPEDIIDKYGADVARLYFYIINPVAEPKKFDFKDVESLYRRFFDTLFNVEKFLSTYSTKEEQKESVKPKDLLDKWIVSKLENLNIGVVEKLDEYDIVGASRLFEKFVDDLSNWYVRRSRKRFQKPKNEKEKEEAVKILNYVLIKFSKILAPFAPFTAEIIYKEFGRDNISVHLEDYPIPNQKLISSDLEERMEEARQAVALALAQRAKEGIKVRQPLASLQLSDKKLEKQEELLELIKEEVNVKNITFGKELKLNTKLTQELKEEGMIRDVLREVQNMRKKSGLVPQDKIIVSYSGDDEFIKLLEKHKENILKEGLIKDLNQTKEAEVKVGNYNLWITIKKV